MNRLSCFIAIFGGAAAFWLVGCSTNNGMAPVSDLSARGPAGIPVYMPTRSQPAPVISAYQVPYGGGPVLTVPKAYFIFWGYKTFGDPDKVAKLLESYCRVQGGSGHNNIYTQYYEIVDGKKIYITNPRNQCGGFYFDEKDAVPQNPTDAQVAAEALIGAQRFGYDPNGSYVVATPNGRSSVGFGTQWCAYHSVAYSGGNVISYTNLPYMPNAGGDCGANFIKPPRDESGADEGVTIVEGNEYGESVTDPEGTGWDLGGLCVWTDVKNDPFHGKSYTMFPVYSNASQSCVQSYK